MKNTIIFGLFSLIYVLSLSSCTNDVKLTNTNIKIEPYFDMTMPGKAIKKGTFRAEKVDCQEETCEVFCDPPLTKTCYESVDGSFSPDPFEDCDLIDAILTFDEDIGLEKAGGVGILVHDNSDFITSVELEFIDGSVFTWANGSGTIVGEWVCDFD